MTQGNFFEDRPEEQVTWIPTHEAGSKRLSLFLPRAGQAYARQRNFDFGPRTRSNVSALSPWVRHRLLLEEDVLRETLARHRLSAAEKFIQEVFWRGYFKGWLEHRPEVWRRYRIGVRDHLDTLERNSQLAVRYEAALSGKTGIACFDSWARELVETGYLHNHARMWFASIWIFTLRLPWELGADFFYRHLLDGDPASNTCSWRWVGGLHTKGKTYLARADNIARYTEGRFNPAGELAVEAPPLEEPDLPAVSSLQFEARDLPGDRIGLLITEEDCSPGSLPLPLGLQSVLSLTAHTPRSLLPMGELARQFAPHAVENAAADAQTHFDCEISLSVDADWQSLIKDWALSNELDAILTARLPLGPVARRLRQAAAKLSIPLVEITRDYDRAVWPHAKRGFFGLKKKLPQILTGLGLH